MKKYMIVVTQNGINGVWNGERISYGSYKLFAKVYTSYNEAKADASIIDGIDGYEIKEII